MLSNVIIQRNRLIKLAGRLSGCRILYVEAPAGCGKTVFAGQWLEDREGPKTAVTLNGYDNTAGDLCRKLRRAVQELCVEEEELRSVSEYTENPDFEKAPVEFLMRAAAALPREKKGNMVIDDLHDLTDSDVHRILQIFLNQIPAGIKICILSRCAPPKSFSGLVLKNDLIYITREQMLFDSSEIRALYKSRNHVLTKKQAEEVLAFTEGWPIAVGVLLLSEGGIPAGSMPEDWLESFLETQVWGMWDEMSREFMVATCMEDRLTADLCNALTGEKDSAGVLERLLGEGAFLFRQREGTYRFHRLFQDFLKKIFFSRGEEYRFGKIRAAGRWYREHHDFYHAVQRFSDIRDYDEIANCFDLLEKMDRSRFDTEQVMQAVTTALDRETADRYPYLYFMMAFTARNEGRIQDFLYYADRYYENYSRIVERNPELAHNIFFLYMMDHRVTLKDISQKASGRVRSTFQGVRGSATLYFPFYHRSFRDFSELLPGDIDEELRTLEKIFGPLLGEECGMILNCIKAGLSYEQGKLEEAQEYAVAAAGMLHRDFAPESKFCVMVMLLAVHHALGQPGQEEAVRRDIQKMIDEDGAYYLQFNFDAVRCKNRLYSGDADAAKRWIEARGSEVYGQLDYFRLYGHFTSARAHIALGNLNQAVILLEKLSDMCSRMNRPIDKIEAEILLAVAYWKKKRGNQKKALLYLENAIRTARPLGYEQIFINEGAELETMLCSLKNRTGRSDYTGDLDGSYIHKLYIRAAEQSSRSKGLTGGRGEMDVSFTRQQKRVMRLMCEGYSYRQIAEELGIKFSTVRSHIELIYRKLDVSGMKDAVLKIRRLHILEDS